MSELDELFEVPLGGFVAARDRLARRLKQEGKGEEAAEVAALRKPAVPVWVVNQLARRRRRDVDLLLDAGHRLRAAQAEADPEKARDGFGKARDAEREAMRRLRAGAEELLTDERGGASQAMVERVLATLRAAAVTEAGRELLARGRLTEELETTGFELAATLVPKQRPRQKPRPAKKPQVDAARAELERARKREREAMQRVEAAEAELEQARREAEAAAKAVAAAETALERAKRRAD